MSKENSVGANIATTSAVATVTMSSLELVEFVNGQRQRGEAVIAHSDFLKKVPKVLGEDHAGKFSCMIEIAIGKGATRKSPCYRFPKREACLMAMSYSYDIQAKVFDRMTELEAAAAQPALNPVNLTRMQLIELAREAEGERLVLESKVDQFKTSVASAIQTLQDALRPESGELSRQRFQAFREAQASLAKAPASPNPAPQPKLSTFEFEGCTVRVVTDATGETRFVGKDVCQVLGFSRHSMVINAYCRENPTYHRILTSRGIQPHRLLFETDVAALVERSRSPLAGTFWTAVQSGVFAAQGGKAA